MSDGHWRKILQISFLDRVITDVNVMLFICMPKISCFIVVNTPGFLRIRGSFPLRRDGAQEQARTRRDLAVPQRHSSGVGLSVPGIPGTEVVAQGWAARV